MINHPIPRPASSRDTDDEQHGKGRFHRGRIFVFVGIVATAMSLPEEYARRFLIIVALTLIAYAIAGYLERKFRHA